MKELYVVTHTESQHHVDKRVGGWYDSELTEKGRKDADELGQRLQIMDAHKADIYSSDLKRAAQTADRIAAAIDSTVVLTPQLREMSYGVAEGRPQQWLDERIVPVAGDNRLDHAVIEGGETKRDFVSRIYDFLDGLTLGDKTIISTHAYAATFVIAWWIKMPPESVGYVNFNVQSGKICKLVEDDLFKNRTLANLNL
ncbi:histidine phosphatase family protein [Hahella aquimaris]|uniref:histidine phosphatase family protein n=1 Tax=Hahella sp. HNIBRBA332 TaxID=3015983 RepID=UPI00273C3215|nr:histidine phosphatase family protein [Hahella sp. HNIBRBA332]WLQ16474.1 histidine phosphatase family protein [Hahella sp. HNIBRBA332]